MNILKTVLVLSMLTFFLSAAPYSFSLADEIEEAPVDETISDICTPSDCSPAKPCIESGESCYSINGARYCCDEPPSGGAQSIGE